jgi:AcrR family transcriptional regulator
MNAPRTLNATALRILKAAEQVFLDHGFEGASINDIADKAEINKSLIYHHFGSKEKLWVAVKASIIKSHEGKSVEEMEFPKESFKKFLERFVSTRYELYSQNPAIARLVTWQRLEQSDKELTNVTPPYLNTLTSQIRLFQEKGEIRSDLNPEMVIYFIMTSASMPFMDPPNFFLGKGIVQQKRKYLGMLIDSLYLAFAAHKVT